MLKGKAITLPIKVFEQLTLFFSLLARLIFMTWQTINRSTYLLLNWRN